MPARIRPEPGAREVDPLLAPYLADRDAAEGERLLERLVTDHIQPVVMGVVRRRLGSGWREGGGARDRALADVASEALLRVIARLRSIDSAQRPIADLRAYAAVSAFHACDDYLRSKYPRRARLKNRMRYALTHVPGLALWTNASGEWLAGLDEWRARPPAAVGASLQRLVEDPHAFVAAACPTADLTRADAFALLPPLLRALGRPIELDVLVNVVGELWNVRDLDPDWESQEAVERYVDPRPTAATIIEQRRFLERLWTEVRALPQGQRAALLLGLRDEEGGGILSLFPLTGVASLRDLAHTLEMPAQEFAGLWNELPLADDAIARRLGLMRQQVVNLRKSARERLGRRMRNAGF
jgi:DNA-directed RNA polymerase specialized sigma24 family protein